MKIKQLLILIPLIIFTFGLSAQDETTLVKVGEIAPDFTIKMEDGSVKKLSDLKGKVVWINFFATWCPPCRKELPHLEKDVYKAFQNRNDFEVLVIGREHDWTTVNKFKKDNNYVLPFYPDAKRASNRRPGFRSRCTRRRQPANRGSPGRFPVLDPIDGGDGVP